MFISDRQSTRKHFLIQEAKNYIPAKRADKPAIILSILALASENISSVMTGSDTQHQFAEIFHPFKYPDLIVYNYLNKDPAVTRRVECAFSKSEFSTDEWSAISKAASNRRACINGVIRPSSSVIELSHKVLH
jgi:hypothetical protein